mgnify:CR=1 FL=1
MSRDAARLLDHLDSTAGDRDDLSGDLQALELLGRALAAACRAVGLPSAQGPRSSQRRRQRSLLRQWERLQPLEGPERLEGLDEWLNSQVDEAFHELLQGLRLAPGSRPALAAVTEVVLRALVPWCRSLLRRNPGLLRSADGIREDAVDEAVHGFLLHLLGRERRALLEFDGQTVGAFRGWLVVVFKNHRLSEIRSQDARKRGGDAMLVSLDGMEIGSHRTPNGAADPTGRIHARKALDALPRHLEDYAAQGEVEGRDALLLLAVAARESGSPEGADAGVDAPIGPKTASGRNRALGRVRQAMRDAMGWDRDES